MDESIKNGEEIMNHKY